MINRSLIAKARREEIKEIAEDFKCEYPNHTDEQVEEYGRISEFDPVELLYFLELIEE